MDDKFKNVPVEEGTNVLFQVEAELDGYDVLYQKWLWDGISAESLIFLSVDVADLSEDEIRSMVSTAPLVNTESEITYKDNGSGYTFVNFNFKLED